MGRFEVFDQKKVENAIHEFQKKVELRNKGFLWWKSF